MSPSDCDTSNVTFSGTVQPIIQNNCTSCHNQISLLGNVNLVGYDNVALYAGNGLLVGTIRHSAGFKPMPQSQPMLDECDIEFVEAWIRDGAQNN